MQHGNDIQRTTETTTRRASVRRRAWRRSARPTIGFAPWGLVGLFLLLVAFLFGVTRFARVWVEGQVAAAVRADLDAAGHDEVRVLVDGQDVRLVGKADPGVTEDELEALALVAKAPTWLGALAAARTAEATLEVPPAEPAPGWADFDAALDDKVLTLRGEVADEAERASLGALARGLVDGTRITSVVDALDVRAAATAPGSAELAERAVRTVGMCVDGRASVQDGVFGLRCLAPAEAIDAVRSAASADPAPGRLGRVDVVPAEAVASCQSSFESLLARSTIRFSSGSAELAASSDALLDRIAEIAADCPGFIRVEGHTDDTGALEANMALSEARARAVVDALTKRNVDAARLRAVGYGPKRPRAVGADAAARARNRRIEFHVFMADEAEERP